MRRALALLALVSCGSTGSDRFPFEAHARGVTPAAFTNANGWDVTLARATFTVGPVYLAPQAGRDAERYVGEVLDRIRVDALSPAAVAFPANGEMTEDHVRSAEIWLGSEVAFEFAGSARRDGESRPFEGRIVLDERFATGSKPGAHSATPLVELRKVRGVPAAFFPRAGGALEIRIDARELFAGADFTNDDQVMKTAAAGLRATATYEVQWIENR